MPCCTWPCRLTWKPCEKSVAGTEAARTKGHFFKLILIGVWFLWFICFIRFSLIPGLCAPHKGNAYIAAQVKHAFPITDPATVCFSVLRIVNSSSLPLPVFKHKTLEQV